MGSCRLKPGQALEAQARDLASRGVRFRILLLTFRPSRSPCRRSQGKPRIAGGSVQTVGRQSSPSLSGCLRVENLGKITHWSGGVTPSGQSLKQLRNVHSFKDLAGGGTTMRVTISAYTHRAFSHGPMPLAHLKLRPLEAVNDNNAVFSPPRGCLTFPRRRVAYGRGGFIVAVLALVAGIIALPLLQELSAPLILASEGRSKVLRGSPSAPTLQQPQENG